MRSENLGTGVDPKSVFEITTASRQEISLPFYIKNAGRFITTSDYYIERNGNDSYLLLYTTRGMGAMETDNQKILLPKNHALIIDCSKPHKYYCSSADGWDFLWISMNGSGIFPLFGLLYPDRIHSVDMHAGNNMEQQISDIIDNIDIKSSKNYITRSLKLHTLIYTVLTAAFDTEKDIGKKYSKEIDYVIEYIHKNYSRQISLDDILENIHISRYHFIRIFHNTIGSTPYNYLTRYRITIAKKLLSQTQKSVWEIAAECGFLDTSQFIRRFKSLTGFTPNRFRTEFSVI